MAVAETANLLVKLSLGGNFQSQIGKATSSLKGFDRQASRSYKAGAQIGTGIKRGAYIAAAGVGFLAAQVAVGLDQLIELEGLAAQTNATLKSTGNVAGQTADSIRALAEKYEGLNATVDDKVIQSGENLLLTFTAINKEAFEPALAASLDLSKALGTDLNSAIKTVGKALSDPTKATAKLARQGIILTKSEQKQIAAHIKNNDKLGAQNVILAALQKRYGGSFLAGGNTTAGKVAKFGNAIEDLQKTLATALLPAIGHIADSLNELFRDPATIAAAEDLGKQIGKLFSKENIDKGIDALKTGFALIRSIAGPIAEIVGSVVKAFTSLPPELQKLLVGGFVVNKLTGGLVTNVFGGIAEAIAKSFIRAPLVNVQGGVVTVTGGIGGGIPGGGGGLGSGLPLPLIAGAAGAAALGSKAVADFTNAEFTKAGFTNVDFEAPGGGPFGITSLVHNMQVLVGLLGQRPGATPAPDTNDDRTREVVDRARSASEHTTTAVESMKGKLAAQLTGGFSAEQTSLERTTSSVGQTRAAVESARGQVAASGSLIVGAIQANRPIVNVNVSPTTIQHTTNVMNRYGSTGGSRYVDGGNIREGAD